MKIWLVVMAGAVGAASGAVVVAMSMIAQFMHRALYNLGRGEFLSSQLAVNPVRALLVPSLGGLVLGVAGVVTVKWVSRRVVDPIEANALYGGTMSFKDSFVRRHADHLVQRRRRIGWARGRLRADRVGHGVTPGPIFPASAVGHAADRRLRCGRRDRGRL